MKNKLFIGNVVSFVKNNGYYSIDIIREDVKLYQIDKTSFIDISLVEDDNINIYVKEVLHNCDKSKIISSLSLQKYFVDEKSLKPYIKKVYKLTR